MITNRKNYIFLFHISRKQTILIDRTAEMELSRVHWANLKWRLYSGQKKVDKKQ